MEIARYKFEGDNEYFVRNGDHLTALRLQREGIADYVNGILKFSRCEMDIIKDLVKTILSYQPDEGKEERE